MEEFLDFEKSLTQKYSKLRCMRKYLPADELDMRIRFLYSTMICFDLFRLRKRLQILINQDVRIMLFGKHCGIQS